MKKSFFFTSSKARLSKIRWDFSFFPALLHSLSLSSYIWIYLRAEIVPRTFSVHTNHSPLKKKCTQLRIWGSDCLTLASTRFSGPFPHLKLKVRIRFFFTLRHHLSYFLRRDETTVLRRLVSRKAQDRSVCRVVGETPQLRVYETRTVTCAHRFHTQRIRTLKQATGNRGTRTLTARKNKDLNFLKKHRKQ